MRTQKDLNKHDLLNQFGEHKKRTKNLSHPWCHRVSERNMTRYMKQLAEETMKHVDVVIIVTPQRIKSFVKTCELFKKESQRVIKVLNFKELNVG